MTSYFIDNNWTKLLIYCRRLSGLSSIITYFVFYKKPKYVTKSIVIDYACKTKNPGTKDFDFYYDDLFQFNSDLIHYKSYLLTTETTAPIEPYLLHYKILEELPEIRKLLRARKTFSIIGQELLVKLATDYLKKEYAYK